jgi:hypothetical protein
MHTYIIFTIKIKANIIETEYLTIRENNRFGEQPQITLQAREDFA